MAQSNAFDPILAQSRDLFRDLLVEVVQGMLGRADAQITAVAEKTTNQDDQRLLMEARDLVVAHGTMIAGAFKNRYQSDFQKRTNKAKKIGQSFSDFSLDELELVAEDDLEETLKYNDLAARLRRHCEGELGALDQRAGVLLGDGDLQAEDNPFGTAVIAEAYKHALKQSEGPIAVRLALLMLWDETTRDALDAAYHEVNDMLVENSILPKIRYAVSRQDSKAAPGAPAPGEEPAEAAPEPKTPEDMFAALSQMLNAGGAAAGGGGGGGQPGMGVGGIPQVMGAELMSSLSNLQMGNLAAMGEAAAELGPILAEVGNLKNVLHQIKGTSVGAAMGQVDATTLDIVARMFDELFDDPKVPIALKGLIGRLQLPFLKVAIADKELFTRKTHPARQMLDTLGQIGLRLPAEWDEQSPLFPRLESAIQRVVDGYQENVEIFDEVRADLEQVLAEDDERVAKEMEAEQEKLRRAESLAMAKSVAQDEIRKRVESAAAAPRPVVEFLVKEWIKYLVVVIARDGAESAPAKSALETIDQLLWSVAPKAAPEERRKLPSTIPPLLKGLRTGIAAAGIEEAAASAFLSELMKCHTEVMRGPPPAPPPAPAKRDKAIAGTAGGTQPAPPAPPPPPPAVALDALDFTAPVTLNNPFGEGQVEVTADDLDFTATTPAPIEAFSAESSVKPFSPEKSVKPVAGDASGKSAGRDKAVRLPSAMVVGAWVEILDPTDERMRPARLHYVSPMKSHFLFVDRKGAKVYECSRTMLARRLKLGEVGLLEGEPDASLFDRIVEGLFGKLRAGAPAPA